VQLNRSFVETNEGTGELTVFTDNPADGGLIHLEVISRKTGNFSESGFWLAGSEVRACASLKIDTK
jgi:hypothetical protein